MCVCVLNTVCMERGERVCAYEMLIKFEGYREPCMNVFSVPTRYTETGKTGKAHCMSVGCADEAFSSLESPPNNGQIALETLREPLALETLREPLFTYT